MQHSEWTGCAGTDHRNVCIGHMREVERSLLQGWRREYNNLSRRSLGEGGSNFCLTSVLSIGRPALSGSRTGSHRSAVSSACVLQTSLLEVGGGFMQYRSANGGRR